MADSRRLDDLDPKFRPLVVEFLARLTEAKIPVLIVGTWRSQTDHEENVKAGKSWATHSLHCSGLAIDICPYASWGPVSAQKVLLWNVQDTVWADDRWEEVGKIGESCGLEWGGRWKSHPDRPHFQFKV